MRNESLNPIESIKRYIVKNREIILKDLQKLISFQTVSGAAEEMEDCLDWFLGRAETLGFKTYKTAEKDVGIVEAGQGEETLGVLVHLDVVDPGDPEKWKFPPYGGTIAEGSIWGRGTEDDKGPALVCLYAMKALLDLGVPFYKKIQLVAGTREETEWTDIEHFKRDFPCPDYGFTPDGGFPVCNIENGYADVLLEFEEGESRRRYGDYEADAGRDPNTVPSKATMTLRGKDYTFQGISTHSSTPEEGVNAIEKLCESGLVDACFTRFINEVLEGDIYGGKLRMAAEELCWEGQALPKTTFAPTVLKQKGDTVTININIRQNAGVKREDIEKAFDQYRKTYRYNYKIMQFLNPVKVSKNRKPFTIMAETYEDWGMRNHFAAERGTSYAKAMENFVSWGPCLPGEPSLAHQENERVGIDSLFKAMGIYTDYMRRIVTKKERLL